MKPRIMYIECKADGLAGGDACIGLVTFSKTGQTIYHDDRTFHKIAGGGFKANYYEETSKEEYWISGPKKNSEDRLYGERAPIKIDEDVRERHWIEIRELPANKDRATSN